MADTGTMVILMATYNGQQYLAEQIDSIICQSYQDWTLLVSDDCSSDATLQVASDYAARDSRVRYASNEERGGSAQANFLGLIGSERLAGKAICFCDQDDVWEPFKLENGFTLLRELNSVAPGLVHTDLKVVDSELRVIEDSFMGYTGLDAKGLAFKDVLFQNYAPGCTIMVNAELAKRMAEQSDELRSRKIIMHDWWAMLLAYGCGNAIYSAEKTMLYRQHDANSIGATGSKIRIKSLGGSLADARSQVDLCFKQAEIFKELNYSILNDAAKRDLNYFLDLRRHGIIQRIVRYRKMQGSRKMSLKRRILWIVGLLMQ